VNCQPIVERHVTANAGWASYGISIGPDTDREPSNIMTHNSPMAYVITPKPQAKGT
jgi:hypothetical protein